MPRDAGSESDLVCANGRREVTHDLVDCGFEIAGRDVQLGIRPEAIEAITRSIPLGRPGTAQEAADAVYLFCIPESNYISGQTIVVGGGI